MASSVMCAAEVKSGALVALLTDYALEPVDVHAIFPGGPKPSAKVRAFVDYLAKALAAPVRKSRHQSPWLSAIAASVSFNFARNIGGPSTSISAPNRMIPARHR